MHQRCPLIRERTGIMLRRSAEMQQIYTSLLYSRVLIAMFFCIDQPMITVEVVIGIGEVHS